MDTFKNIKKSYVEGIYCDSPANRKLGRVGMTYSDYALKLKKEKENQDSLNEELTKGEDKKLSLKEPEVKSEYYRKKNFSNFKEGDIVYIAKNYKLEAGNYKVESIAPLYKKKDPKDEIIIIKVSDDKGNVYSFVKDFLFGWDPFDGFKILDINYSLQK